MANDKSILFFFGEEEIKTMVSALMKAFNTADLNARYANIELDKKREEVNDLKTKLEAAEARLVVMDAAYADLDDERAAWKEKYDREVAGINKKYEQEGK